MLHVKQDAVSDFVVYVSLFLTAEGGEVVDVVAELAKNGKQRCFIHTVKSALSTTCIERPQIFVFLENGLSLKHVPKGPVHKDQLPMNTTFLVSLGWSL